MYIKSLMCKPGRSTLLMALDEQTAWSENTYLLARVSDALELSNFLYLKANFEDAADLEAPQAIPRPGQSETTPETEFSSAAEVSDFFGHMNSL